jgi:hypothetical protein
MNHLKILVMILFILPLIMAQGKTPLSVGEGKGVRLLKQATGKECVFEVLEYVTNTEEMQKRLAADLEERFYMNLYPNPANNILKASVYIPENYINPVLTIHDLTGRRYEQLTLNHLLNEIELNISDYSDGIYLIQVKTQNSVRTVRVSILR